MVGWMDGYPAYGMLDETHVFVNLSVLMYLSHETHVFVNLIYGWMDK